MNITIKGSGVLVPHTHVPDGILALAYPYMTIEDSPDGGLFVELSPYVEVYNETEIRKVFVELSPFIEKGRIDCYMSFDPGTYPTIRWSFYFMNDHVFRESHGTGSYITSYCIDE